MIKVERKAKSLVLKKECANIIGFKYNNMTLKSAIL